MKYEFVQKNPEFKVGIMCDVLGVSQSGYHAWRSRPPSKRDKENRVLLDKLTHYHKESRQTYGIKRLQADLLEEGWTVNHKRIARLKQENNLYPKTYKPFVVTTDSNHDNPIVENVLNREFEQKQENAVWVSDITYIPLLCGWLYLAVIIDLYSRRVVGWKLDVEMKTELVISAFENARINRSGVSPALFHSDRGVQYTSGDMQDLLSEQDVKASMSRKGNCWDNAVSESFFGTLKRELIGNRKYSSIDEAKADIFEYIEVFYNRKRRHSAIGYVSPVEFERVNMAA